MLASPSCFSPAVPQLLPRTTVGVVETMEARVVPTMEDEVETMMAILPTEGEAGTLEGVPTEIVVAEETMETVLTRAVWVGLAVPRG